jgi:hypothetical protein
MLTKHTPLLCTLINLIGVTVVVIGWAPVPGYFLLEPILYCGIVILCLALLPAAVASVRRRSLLAYVAFALWVVFSDSTSGEFLPALARDLHWLILPLLTVLYTRIFAGSGESLKVLQVAVALSLLLICYRVIHEADSVVLWASRMPMFGNVRRMAMTVGLMTVFLYHDVRYREKWLLTLARIVGLSLLFWSGSRGAMLAWAVALWIFVWHTGQWARLRAWALEATVAVFLAILFDVGDPQMGLLTGALFRTWNRAVVGGSIDAVSSSRVTWWLKTLSTLQDSHIALFGAGGNGFVRLELWYRQIFHPHNIVLQVLTDWGVGGLLLFLWLVKEGMPNCLKRTGKDGVAGLGLALMAFLLITGLLDGGLYHLQYLFFASIAFALIASAAPVEEPANTVTIPRLGIAVLLLSSMFVHWVLKDYRTLSPMNPLRQPYVAPSRDGSQACRQIPLPPAQPINNPLILK